MPPAENFLPPRYDLIDARNYYGGALQFSRGCPYTCSFCGIWSEQGRSPRVKSPAQIHEELDLLYASGHRGITFIVDDNLIGRPKEAAAALRATAEWQKAHGYPFQFYSQSDVRIGGSERFSGHLELMRDAGFFAVFLGLETQDPEKLKAASKGQNVGVDYVAVTRALREHGIHTYAGGILGLDGDTPQSFQDMVDMFTACKVFFAMPSMLVALPGTVDYTRFFEEGRLLNETGGDNLGLSNVLPRPDGMSHLELVRGFRHVLERLYEPRAYFDRARAAMEEWQPGAKRYVGPRDIKAAFGVTIRQGFRDPWAAEWRRYARDTIGNPLVGKGPQAMAISITGRHLLKLTREFWVPNLRQLEAELARSAA